MRRPRLLAARLSAPAIIAAALAACGSSGPRTITVVQVKPHPKPKVLKVPDTGKPSQCTVWLTTGSALVTFQADGYSIVPACQAWITNSAKNGSLWTDQTPSDIGPYVNNPSQVCVLKAKNGWEYATVQDDTTNGGTDGQTACEGLLATGDWQDQPLATSPNYNPPKPPYNQPAPSSTPTVKIGKFNGREPSIVGFSADGSNVVTNIKWTTWGTTQALGKGQSVIQTCVPDCATGGQMPVPAYILLGDPVNGRFTHLTESQGGQISHAVYPSGKYPNIWPWEAYSYKQVIKHLP